MIASIARSVGMVVLFVFGVWAVGELIGYEIGLMSMLVASVVLTVIGNLVLMGIQRVSAA